MELETVFWNIGGVILVFIGMWFFLCFGKGGIKYSEDKSESKVA